MSNLKEEEDYYINDNGFLVFTAAYHLRRGSCCGNGCLHCPYKMPHPTPPKGEGIVAEMACPNLPK
jgi:Family of unknown function (DUF5522)